MEDSFALNLWKAPRNDLLGNDGWEDANTNSKQQQPPQLQFVSNTQDDVSWQVQRLTKLSFQELMFLFGGGRVWALCSVSFIKVNPESKWAHYQHLCSACNSSHDVVNFQNWLTRLSSTVSVHLWNIPVEWKAQTRGGKLDLTLKFFLNWCDLSGVSSCALSVLQQP